SQECILPFHRRHRSRDPPGATSRWAAATVPKGPLLCRFGRQEAHLFRVSTEAHSAAVCEMFRGFSGYIQADAHAIYDALFRGDAVGDGAAPPIEVACWSHARRRLWE